MTESASSLEQALAKATDGLTYPSETDAPVEPFFLDGHDGEPTADEVATAARLDPEAPAEETSVDEFFAPVVEVEYWYGAEEREAVRRFRRLKRLLERELEGTKVFRIGEREIHVFVVGRAGDRFAGVRTRVVET